MSGELEEDPDIRALLTYARSGSMKAAAHEMGVSLPTVKRRLSRLYLRLEVSSGIEALYVLTGGLTRGIDGSTLARE